MEFLGYGYSEGYLGVYSEGRYSRLRRDDIDLAHMGLRPTQALSEQLTPGRAPREESGHVYLALPYAGIVSEICI